MPRFRHATRASILELEPKWLRRFEVLHTENKANLRHRGKLKPKGSGRRTPGVGRFRISVGCERSANLFSSSSDLSHGSAPPKNKLLLDPNRLRAATLFFKVYKAVLAKTHTICFWLLSLSTCSVTGAPGTDGAPNVREQIDSQSFTVIEKRQSHQEDVGSKMHAELPTTPLITECNFNVLV